MIAVFFINLGILVSVTILIITYLLQTKDSYNQQLLITVNVQNYAQLKDKDRALQEIKEEKEMLRRIVVTAIKNLELIARITDSNDSDTNIEVLSSRLDNVKQILHKIY